MTTMSVTLRWLSALRAEAQTEDGISVQVNAARNWGEGSAVSPMELLLVSLGSCSALADDLDSHAPDPGTPACDR